jgi:hypothetical protein
MQWRQVAGNSAIVCSVVRDLWSSSGSSVRHVGHFGACSPALVRSSSRQPLQRRWLLRHWYTWLGGACKHMGQRRWSGTASSSSSRPLMAGVVAAALMRRRGAEETVRSKARVRSARCRSGGEAAWMRAGKRKHRCLFKFLLLPLKKNQRKRKEKATTVTTFRRARDGHDDATRITRKQAADRMDDDQVGVNAGGGEVEENAIDGPAALSGYDPGKPPPSLDAPHPWGGMRACVWLCGERSCGCWTVDDGETFYYYYFEETTEDCAEQSTPPFSHSHHITYWVLAAAAGEVYMTRACAKATTPKGRIAPTNSNNSSRDTMTG